jgi:hypothetical protein
MPRPTPTPATPSNPETAAPEQPDNNYMLIDEDGDDVTTIAVGTLDACKGDIEEALDEGCYENLMIVRFTPVFKVKSPRQAYVLEQM